MHLLSQLTMPYGEPQSTAMHLSMTFCEAALQKAPDIISRAVWNNTTFKVGHRGACLCQTPQHTFSSICSFSAGLLQLTSLLGLWDTLHHRW